VNELARGRLAMKYILFELLPIFLLGMSIFVIVLIMFQSFQLSEYVIIHGASLTATLQLIFYTALGFLPILLPIALMFAVLLTYGRMSGDSEIVAFKALGLGQVHLLIPAMVLGTVISAFSLQTSFRLAPWGNLQLNNLITHLAQTRPGVTIREGVFSEGAFDLVIYASKVNSREGLLKKVFIFDERDAKAPLTIIAKEGELVSNTTESGQEAFLRLTNGSVHKYANEFYTKIDFSTYDINLFDPNQFKERKAGPESMDMQQLRDAIAGANPKDPDSINFSLEWHRRWALSATCLIFALVGFSMGTVTNRRAARSGSMVICISAIVIYWAMYVGFESLIRSGNIPAPVGAWMTNFIFFLFGIYQYRRAREN
jgi:lipopolysaccharide export system permease protein